VIQKTLTLGALVAFVQYSQRFFRPISDMSEKFNVMQSAMASSERIFKLLDEPVAIQSPARPRKRPAPALGHIRFEGVWFAYNAGEKRSATPGTEETRTTPDASSEVRPGERVGIVGATGSGKTTLINLLLRFYDVGRGRITIDGINIRELDLADVRGLFSLVLQDVHLFSGTVSDNIRLGNQAISDERVRSAARAVHAEPFIARMPAGYASAIAERGATLSVGQKQLLSFARALAFDPRVLVLDEATSSVDTDTELIIRDALQVLMADRTTIAIAHRLSTIQDMDKILVLHKGQLRESGTHQELLAQRGIYYKLFELQYRQDGNLGKVEVRSEKLEVEG
jgi:ATP-binding cassette subfamily B protein